MDFSNITKQVAQKTDSVNRADLVPLTCKHVGYQESSHHISSVKMYRAEAAVPTRVQIQAALNRAFGQLVLLEPTSICVGKHCLTMKVLSKAKLPDQSEPKGAYLQNLKAALDERPKAKLMEVGDIVRVFRGFVEEGEIAGGNADGSLNVRIGEKIEVVAADSVIDVKKAPKFFPIDDVAYEYFSKIYPREFAKLLCNTDPLKVENAPKR